MIVSNPAASSPGGGAKITTHWIFWGENCIELADYSVCLTERDTIVVDPTNMSAIGPDNKPNGPTINLSGSRGLVTVTAYQTDSDCNPWDETGRQLAQEALVGTFTIADLTYGYSFGNDALGLFSSNNQVQLPNGNVERYVLQTLNPTTAPGIEAGSLVGGVDRAGGVELAHPSMVAGQGGRRSLFAAGHESTRSDRSSEETFDAIAGPFGPGGRSGLSRGSARRPRGDNRVVHDSRCPPFRDIHEIARLWTVRGGPLG